MRIKLNRLVGKDKTRDFGIGGFAYPEAGTKLADGTPFNKDLYQKNLLVMFMHTLKALPAGWIDLFDEFSTSIERLNFFTVSVGKKGESDTPSAALGRTIDMHNANVSSYTTDNISAFFKIKDYVSKNIDKLTWVDLERADPVLADFFLWLLGRRLGRRDVLDVISLLICCSREVGAVPSENGELVTITIRDNPFDKDVTGQVVGSKGMIQWIRPYFAKSYNRWSGVPVATADAVYAYLSTLPWWYQYFLAELYYHNTVQWKRLPRTLTMSWDTRTRKDLSQLLMRDAYYYSVGVPGVHYIDRKISDNIWTKASWTSKTNKSSAWLKSFGISDPMDLVMRGPSRYDLQKLGKELWDALVAGTKNADMLAALEMDTLKQREAPPKMRMYASALVVRLEY